MEWSDALRIIRDEFGLDGELLEGLVDYLLDGRIIKKEGAELRFMGHPVQEYLTASRLKRSLKHQTLSQVYDSMKSDGRVEPQWYGAIFFLNNNLDRDQLPGLVNVVEEDARLSELADVTVYRPKDFLGLIVFTVPDYTGNVAAEKEAAKIFDYLYKIYGLKVICAEGAEGKVDTSIFDLFDDADTREKVSRYFVIEGQITAPEYLTINADYPVLLYGVEDTDLYRALLKQQLETSDTLLPYEARALFERRKGILVNNTLNLMKKEDLNVAAFHCLGNDWRFKGVFDPDMFIDKGVICIVLDTKTKHISLPPVGDNIFLLLVLSL
jgi:hypothetical protein